MWIVEHLWNKWLEDTSAFSSFFLEGGIVIYARQQLQLPSEGVTGRGGIHQHGDQHLITGQLLQTSQHPPCSYAPQHRATIHSQAAVDPHPEQQPRSCSPPILINSERVRITRSPKSTKLIQSMSNHQHDYIDHFVHIKASNFEKCIFSVKQIYISKSASAVMRL